MKSWLIVVIAFVLMVNIAAFSQDDVITDEGMARVAELLDVIDKNFYRDLKPGNVIDASIRGLLGELDPHSSYFTREQTIQMRSEQQGEYSGVGLTIGLRNGSMTVISPMEDGPGDKAGIRTGDLISGIDGIATSRETYNDDVNRLRGPRGSDVTLTVERENKGKFDVVVTRDSIALKTVPYYFMIDEEIGYVRLTSFARDSAEEVEAAVADLLVQGMRKMILDLRSNPGGDLNAASKVADLFVNEGLITYMESFKPGSRTDFAASAEGLSFNGALVVMMNPNSASGSEVVSGALQDHDRAWVVGEKSWGKGLVQTQYPLSHGAVLSLTTAKYYTPSGRLIQRPYVRGSFDEYFFSNAGDADLKDSATTLYLKRPVYGGNGISPDTEIKSNPVSELTRRILFAGHIFGFVTEYISSHEEIDADYRADDEMMSAMKGYLVEKEMDIDEAMWLQDAEFLKDRLNIEILTRLAGAGNAYQAVMTSDVQLQEAIARLHEAERLLNQRLQMNQ